MPLSAGTRLGPYEVAAPLGSGGMGEVYRARDAKLDRDVALKVLPASFASDADRLMRFEREARALAALNHPNIAAIYGVEDTTDTKALVMELVEGPTLEELIRASVGRRRSTIDVLEWALPIARQIADALEAAHEQGIIHRDLKPANVKVRPDGTVKVLDFGLAKALDAGSKAPTSIGPENSPTVTSPALTQMGVILGTAAYMSPEQAKGRPVDKRADIWAFGVVLYEMLTSRRAFEGEDVSTTLAAVLMKDPQWTALPADLPTGLRTLIHRCLERDPKARLRDIGEARLALTSPDATRAEPASPVASRRSSRMPWILTAAGALAAAVFAALWLWNSSSSPDDTRIEASIGPPPGQTLGGSFALSPDGRRLVMQAMDPATGATSLWLRELSSRAPVRLPGTEGGSLPF